MHSIYLDILISLDLTKDSTAIQPLLEDYTVNRCIVVFSQIIDNVTKKCALLEKEMHQKFPQIFSRYTHVRGKG